jgi:CheY-like chemotaxis protein/HPt (histidine-containing phosphotransfer) domain-containing protein
MKLVENNPIMPAILFADDVPENRMLVEIVLKKTGCAVTCCANGKEAVECAEKQKFDVILMDIQMPVMDGIEATKRIKAGGMNRHTPVIALTASDTKEDAIMCLEAGFEDHLSKPVKHDLLRRKVEKFAKQATSIRNALSGGDVVSLLADDRDYRKTIEIFLSGLPGRITEMRDAFDKSNIEDLAAKVHALKGLGGFAGFPIYTEKAKELEELMQSNKLDDVRRQLDELSELCQRTKLSGSGSTQRPS